ncbi:hypothetical protein LCGC14_1313290 [marine sediment metagenome]|uniref:Uncharacterized protein n=1 Tax=marine sediment metagenome TaxID=412755 RepID=A0A0F9NP36_9ZZZZ
MGNKYDLHATETGLTELPETTEHSLLLLVDLVDTVAAEYAQSLEDPGFPGLECS